MPEFTEPKIGFMRGSWDWWNEHRARDGFWTAFRTLVREGYEFLRDLMPTRRRLRYGDVEYDWDYRVDTTSATVGWRDQLLGVLHSPYQPTDPGLFHEMLAGLHIEHREFTFVDLGSGKGRVLLMASDYPFRRIVGIELLPQLHRIAQENLRSYRSPRQKCFAVESQCGDGAEFRFPPEPTVLYLFNPLSHSGLQRMIMNLDRSLRESPRPLYVLYHNPLLEQVVASSELLRKIGGTHQYSAFKNNSENAP